MLTPASERAQRFDSQLQEAYLNLWRTYDRLRGLEDEFFSPFGLTAQQYNMLRVLKARHPRTLPTLELAQRLVSRAPDITRMLDKLEERGLVARERSKDDRRSVHVAITAAGLALVEQLHKPLSDCQSRQLGHLSNPDLQRLIELLRAARAPHEDESSAWRG